MITECAICYTVGECFNDGEAYICVDREACSTRKAPYANCLTCPLRTAPCVPSYRPEQIDLIVVGEAPGKDEVSQGKPFVGRSGKLLDAALEHVGIEPANVYRTNAVLCRPPNNDLTPYAKAVVACQERLRRELETIECSDMVALGATATTALDTLSGEVSNGGILKRRGQWYTNDSFSYLATLHPAFVLRNTGYMSQFITDLRSITLDRNDDKWRNITPIILSYETVTVFELEIARAISQKTIVAFDVETENTNPRSQLLALGLTWCDDEAWIISGNQISKYLPLLNNLFQAARMVAHNGKFDQQVLYNNGVEPFDLFDDTMLQHYSLDENKGTHGLKQLASSWLGVYDYEAELIDVHFRNQEREKRNYGTIPTDDLYQYLALDCCVTRALYYLFDPLIDTDDVRGYHKIAVAASNSVQYTERWGITVDVPYLEQVLIALKQEIETVRYKVQNDARPLTESWLLANPSFTWGHLPNIDWVKTIDQYREVLQKIIRGDGKKTTGINLSSWQQVQVLLYDVLGLKHTKKLGFKTDPRSTNAEALDSLEYHPFLEKIRAYKRLDKIRGTYVEKLITLADENNRVHVNYNIHGTETGRFSANDGLHGIPRPSDTWGQALRGSFIAAPGHKLVMSDYSGGELRIFAAYSGERFLLDQFENDEDPHGNITLTIFGNDPRFEGMTKANWDKTKEKWLVPLNGYSQQEQNNYWKEKRTTGKNVVFGGLVYMGGASGICAMIRAQTGKIIDEQLVARVLKQTLAQMPTATAWQQEQFRKARRDGFVQNCFGFKRRFMLITDENLDDVRKAAVNAPIQGSLSMLTTLSGIQLTQDGFHVLMYNHDQIIVEVPEDVADLAAKVVTETMIGIGKHYFPEVKWKVDTEVGDRWYQDRPSFSKSEVT